MTRKEKTVRNADIIALRRQNWSIQELADRFNLSLSAASLICRNAGLGGKMSDRKAKYVAPAIPKKKNKEDVSAAVKKKIPSFEYAGNYTGSNGTADIRCLICGTVTTRSWTAVRHRKVACEVCKHNEFVKRQKEQRILLRKQREASIAKAEQKKKDSFWGRQFQQTEFKVCVECGRLFIPRNPRQYCCGEECSKRRANKKDKRMRRLKVATVDRSISLKRLYEKESGICYLCNGKCLWEDFYLKDGNKIAGDLYPSIDHVIPLSKGGEHSWKNVRLAHRKCNWMKSDAV